MPKKTANLDMPVTPLDLSLSSSPESSEKELFAQECAISHCTNQALSEHRIDTPVINGIYVKLYVCSECYTSMISPWLLSLK